MKRLLAASLVALLASLVVGVAFADDEDDTTCGLSIEKQEQYYGNEIAPGVPGDIGPDDHNNTHRGENGWHAPDGDTSYVPPVDPTRVALILWRI